MQVIKRDGRLQEFDINKIFRYLELVFGKTDGRIVPPRVVDAIRAEFENIEKQSQYISYEEIYRVIENVLESLGEIDQAKAVVLRRDYLTCVERVNFSLNAIRLLAVRYLWRDARGYFLETVDDLFKRVAVTGALPEIPPMTYKPMRHIEPPISLVIDVYNKLVETGVIGGSMINEKNWNTVQSKDDVKVLTFDIGKEQFFLTRYHVMRLIAMLYRHLANEDDILPTAIDILRNIDTYGEFKNVAYQFYRAMVEQRMMPNTPALVNGGRPLGMLSACFVVESFDSVEGIFDTAKNIALITKAGGGIGLDFSVFRPKDDVVHGTMGVASGAMSWLQLYNSVLDVLKQGSTRRGAGMAVLWYWHPEIFSFIEAKKDNDGFSVIPNFNLSIGTDFDFWEAVRDDKEISLINPRNNEHVGSVRARAILEHAAKYAWKVADPAVLNFGWANELMPQARIRKITATNPCGEEALLPYQSCNLVSVNIAKFVQDGEFDWEGFRETAKLAYRWADNVNDVNWFPLNIIGHTTRQGRNVGVGLMGIADTLFMLGYSYEHADGIKFMEKVARELSLTVIEESVEMARIKYTCDWCDAYVRYVKEYGTLPLYATRFESVDKETQKRIENIVRKIEMYGIRNIDHTTMPPTGSVSMIADTSNGIEPIFGLVYKKVVTVGTFYYPNKIFRDWVQRHVKNPDDYDTVMSLVLNNNGSLKGLEDEMAKYFSEEDLKYMFRVFRTARDLHHWSHLVGMYAIAKWTTNSVSKTINMASDVSINDVYEAFVLSHVLGLRGVTVYRDGSLTSQVMVSGDKAFKPNAPSRYVRDIIKKKVHDAGFDWLLKDKQEEITMLSTLSFAVNHDDDILTTCPECGTPLIREAGCAVCPSCGWSACTVS